MGSLAQNGTLSQKPLMHPLSSAINVENCKKYASFSRTAEHRNYIAKFEAKSSKIARALVDHKMRQLGVVNGV